MVKNKTSAYILQTQNLYDIYYVSQLLQLINKGGALAQIHLWSIDEGLKPTNQLQ